MHDALNRRLPPLARCLHPDKLAKQLERSRSMQNINFKALHEKWAAEEEANV